LSSFERLAIDGGRPVWSGGWPAWPETKPGLEAAVLAALRSGRWTVSGPWTGQVSLERLFAERFAEFCRVRHAVATDHGSESLELALEALDVGPGDEVVVPVLTWVATATAVLNVGATPVFVDAEPRTGCLDLQEAAALAGDATAAAIPVHLHCAMVDVPELRRRLPAGTPVIEDCAQAHGAAWNGTVAGSLGTLGAFSFQQGKVLTSGEGGAVCTNDDHLYDRLLQLRTDGRRYVTTPELGRMDLVDGGLMGRNCCLSELQAAMLLDGLEHLSAQNRRREVAFRRLSQEFDRAGFRVLEPPAQMTSLSIYEVPVLWPEAALESWAIDELARAVSAEIGFSVYRPDPPLHRSPLYRPWTKRRYHGQPGGLARLDKPIRRPFPVADRLYDRLTNFHHRILLAPLGEMDAVVAAFDKVRRAAERGPRPVSGRGGAGGPNSAEMG
jgi:L-glutamine:2-deoxy-scyllo-inosose/3-amino-2,3-dideoxy-scyllo-inosose aminotransferase